MKHKPTEDAMLPAITEEHMDAHGPASAIPSDVALEKDVDALIESAARKVLERYRTAFEELAK